MNTPREPARVTWAAAERLVPRLSARDWRIIRGLAGTRVATGTQLSRLHFAELPASTRDRTRRRVLARLTEWQVLTRLDRTIGGVRAGSTGWVYALGPAGSRLTAREAASEDVGRIRKPWTPSLRFLAHSIAITEVYVGVVERSRTSGLAVAAFDTEPACWWPDGKGGVLKPDALIVLRGARYDETIWLEVDRATESLPTLRRKLAAYTAFWNHDGTGPQGVMPHVVISVPTEKRRREAQTITRALDPQGTLFTVTDANNAATAITGLTVPAASESP